MYDRPFWPDRRLCLLPYQRGSSFSPQSQSQHGHGSAAATPMRMTDNDADGRGEEILLSYQPLAENSTVSAKPHIPSVTASAVLGESDSVN